MMLLAVRLTLMSLHRCEGKDRNRELDLDLDRTFPGHPLLDRESANGAAGTAWLHHVLNSYALRNPEVGYCQSMNFIAGILLIMDVREEDSFWIISHVSDSLLPNYFAPPMLGAQVDNKVRQLRFPFLCSVELVCIIVAHVDRSTLPLSVASLQRSTHPYPGPPGFQAFVAEASSSPRPSPRQDWARPSHDLFPMVSDSLVRVLYILPAAFET